MKKQAWGLLPTVATFSTVIPATLLAGSMTKMIDFPKELGKMSSTNKMGRIADQLKFHTNLSSNCDRVGLVLQHAPTFRENLISPLIRQTTGDLPGNEGVDHVLQFLENYSLTKEDMDSIFELTQWPGKPDPLKNVGSKVKAALTRSYNKSNIMTPYSTNSKEKPKNKRKATENDDESEDSGKESDDDITAFQVKKKKPSKAPSKGKKTKK